MKKFPRVVYDVPWTECHATYISEMKIFSERKRWHRHSVRCFNSAQNSLAEDSEKENHCFNIDDERILRTEVYHPCLYAVFARHTCCYGPFLP